jgi:hypothetical protein
MLRILSFALSLAIALAPLLPETLAAAPAKRHAARHWRGYGFLPGYRPPERLAWEERMRARAREPVYGYWYGSSWYWYGGPRFYRGRWNGGGFGPCWTQTPIGPIWNCGR